MILAELKDYKTYLSLLPQLSEIAELVKNCADQPVGRYETDWGFYMIQEGTTSLLSKGSFESHKKYIDVQCLIDGGEYMEWQDIEKLKLQTEYSAEKDAQFLTGSGVVMKIIPGMFYVMYPEDGHKACGHLEKAVSYRKVVAKIKINE